MSTAARRTESINLRISPEHRALVQRAADVCGKSVSAFVVEAAMEEAQSVLLEQRFLSVPADVFDSFNEIVGLETEPHKALVDLFASKPVWTH